jgi:hypothetical protein
MSVNWAKELGIDIEVLRTEAFTHHSQVYLHNLLERNSEQYWLHRRNSERVEELMEESEVPGQKRQFEKNKRRRERKRRMANYVFSDAQIQMALRSLDAKDSV